MPGRQLAFAAGRWWARAHVRTGGPGASARTKVAIAVLLALAIGCWTIGPAAGRERSVEAAGLARGTDPAVGRLNHAGYARRRHCTGFLVAPRLAATAAHCIADHPVHDFHLLLGYRTMDWLEHLRPTRAVLAREARDLAFVCLRERSSIRPLGLAAGLPVPGEAVTVRGYGRPRVHRQQSIACTVRSRTADGELLLDCGLPPGFSGGPVLRMGDGGPEVVAVVSRSARSYAIATAVSRNDLPDRCPTGSRLDR